MSHQDSSHNYLIRTIEERILHASPIKKIFFKTSPHLFLQWTQEFFHCQQPKEIYLKHLQTPKGHFLWKEKIRSETKATVQPTQILVLETTGTILSSVSAVNRNETTKHRQWERTECAWSLQDPNFYACTQIQNSIGSHLRIRHHEWSLKHLLLNNINIIPIIKAFSLAYLHRCNGRFDIFQRGEGLHRPSPKPSKIRENLNS